MSHIRKRDFQKSWCLWRENPFASFHLSFGLVIIAKMRVCSALRFSSCHWQLIRRTLLSAVVICYLSSCWYRRAGHQTCQESSSRSWFYNYRILTLINFNLINKSWVLSMNNVDEQESRSLQTGGKFTPWLWKWTWIFSQHFSKYARPLCGAC